MAAVDELTPEIREVLGATNDIGIAEQLVAAGVKTFEEAERLIWRRETRQVIAAAQANRRDIPGVGTLVRKSRRVTNE